MSKEEYIFGTRAVIEAIKNGRTIDRILIKKGLKNELYQELFNLIKQTDIPFQFVPVEKINRITRKNHQGILAFLSPVEFHRLENILPGIYETGQDPFLLILDQITDVRNFGAIIRSAECAGVHAVIVPEKGIARIGADAIKTSAGALHHLPVCREKSLTGVVQQLKDSGIKTIGANEKSDLPYTKTNMNLPIAIILGSEDKGISSDLLNMADIQVKIPILGKIGSLNVSVAAAIMLYEAVRQKNRG